MHLKKGDKGKAIQTYTDVADMFSRGGFDAKAVAIYKQILRVEEESLEARSKLGECFQRMGLTSDALREFQDAFKICQKRELKREAFELLRRLASLDPSNVANRLNLAGLFARENLLDDAKREFTSLLEEVRRQTGSDLVIRVAEQMLHAFPDSREALDALAWGKLASGAHAEAVKLLKPAIAKHPDDIPLRETLVSALEGAGDDAGSKAVWREIAELYKRRGDLDKSREILQRHAAVAEFGGEESTTPSLLLTEPTRGPKAHDDEDDVDLELDEPAPATRQPPAAEPARAKPAPAARTGTSFVERGKATPPPLRSPASPPTAATPPKKPLTPPPPAASPEDSASDLLAEARVSLEFGDPQEAARLVRRVLELDPSSADARALLAKAEGGGASEAAEVDIEIDVDVDLDDVGGGDDAMPSLIERNSLEESGEITEPTVAPPPALETSGEDDVSDDTGPALAAFGPGEDFDTLPDIEIVLEDEEDRDEKFASVEPPLEIELNKDAEPARAKPAPAVAKPATPTAVKPAAKPEPKPAPKPAAPAPAPVASDDFDIEIEVDEGTPEPEPDLEPAFANEAAPELDAEPSMEFSRPLASDAPEDLADFEDASSRVMENLGEADFYLDQGLVDEAERIYRSVLERVPGHPKAMLRLGEIDAKRAKKGPAPARKAEPAKLGGDPLGDTMVREPDGREALSLPEIPAPPAEEPLFEPSVMAEETIPPLVLEKAPTDRVVVAQDTEPPFVTAEADDDSLEESSHGSDEEGEFDLAAMLDDEDDDHTGTVGTLMSAGAVGKGFADVFSAFKKGIQEQVDEGDADTHYDLAIAYKEMGLNEDAVRELETVLRTGARAIEALSLLASCKLALGDAVAAAAHIEDALQRAGDSHESAVSLRYDLAEALLAAGREKEAREAFAKVAAVNPKFRDVLERLANFG